jgi:outer membrane protein assembly factor BamB
MIDAVAPSLAAAPSVQETPSPVASPWRAWPGVIAIALYWAVFAVLEQLDMQMFPRFLAEAGSLLLACLVFLIWWMTNRSVSLRDRLLGVAALTIAIVLATLGAHKSLGPALYISAVPLAFSFWAVWLVVSRRASLRWRRIGLVAGLFCVWSFFMTLRTEGMHGSGKGDWFWRWKPTAEELYLADLARANQPAATNLMPAERTLVVKYGDWPEFRGPRRDGKVIGARTVADWTTPPKEIWRRRVGPGWSSVAIVGDMLFTQEQRGDQETVLCLEAATGRQIWAHQDTARHSDSQSFDGPRATPTWANGRLFTLGGTGILNCLDPSTGAVIWKRDLRSDAEAGQPLWGFSSSPLVVNGRVIVFAGGEGPKNLFAYAADTGEVAWAAGAGKMSYSSAQLATILGVEQVLFLGDRGLQSHDPVSGALLWEYKIEGRAARSLQPQVVGTSRILVNTGMEDDTVLLEVKRDGQSWQVQQRWKSGRLRPSFNDFVIHDGSIYGFDKAIFCCLDLETGELRWKDGRYGFGQAVLLADQGALIVVSDEGELFLVAADPSGHNELGKVHGVTGKTWNHPVVAHGRLYVRNAQEMVCFDLPAAR